MTGMHEEYLSVDARRLRSRADYFTAEHALTGDPNMAAYAQSSGARATEAEARLATLRDGRDSDD